MDTVVSWAKNLCMKTETGDVSEEILSWSVLDLGTGNGLLLQALARQGYAIGYLWVVLLFQVNCILQETFNE